MVCSSVTLAATILDKTDMRFSIEVIRHGIDIAVFLRLSLFNSRHIGFLNITHSIFYSLSMMNIHISVITPISPSHKIFLPELAESVDLLKKITKAEWVVCCDGFPVEDLEINGVYPDVSLENSKPEGISISRNRCLASVSGNLISPIDADDIICPHGLGTAAETIKYDNKIGWCGYASQDFDATHQKARIIGEDLNKFWDTNECLEYFQD